ncbi:MAG: Bax inhibitor-1/YccA family protein [Bacteroidetes bacterium]|nr:MAG: Bax inhibitor-1/YccA family protein [Bacteroidota bacterium]
MLDNIFNQKQYGPEAKAMSSEFFVSVYTYMFLALGISGTIAYWFGTEGYVFEYMIRIEYGAVSPTPLFYIVAFAPVLLGLGIQFLYNRLSMPLLLLLFGLYSVLMGLSLSTIFIAYDLGSIMTTFFVTAGGFGAMAFLGYITKTDLTKMGSLLYMLFIGIFIAAIVNFFFHSEMISYLISILGVVVFTGLTAYQMQQLKYIGEDPNLGNLERKKLSLIGGLMLYILFINLFLSLLRLLGNRE